MLARVATHTDSTVLLDPNKKRAVKLRTHLSHPQGCSMADTLPFLEADG
jgi:hypothetical protein